MYTERVFSDYLNDNKSGRIVYNVFEINEEMHVLSIAFIAQPSFKNVGI